DLGAARFCSGSLRRRNWDARHQISSAQRPSSPVTGAALWFPLSTVTCGLPADAVAGTTGGFAVPLELFPGGLAVILTMNMIAKASATAASVIRGLRCFTAPPRPNGDGCEG